jgi:hypothetical protein
MYAILKVYLMTPLNCISIEHCAEAMYRRIYREYRQENFAPEKNCMQAPVADDAMDM